MAAQLAAKYSPPDVRNLELQFIHLRFDIAEVGRVGQLRRLELLEAVHAKTRSLISDLFELLQYERKKAYDK